MASVDTACTTS